MTTIVQDRPPSDHSSGSDSRQSRTPSMGGPGMAGQGSSSKKRASRAGTRSVSTLSAAQLERKRANDREAQRAIRQRTKEHIEKLEKRIAELSSGSESNEQLLGALKRNKELEEENEILRTNLQQANFAISPNNGFEEVPNVKVPNVRMPAQPSVQSGVPLRRSESSSFSQNHHWQNSNPFASPTTSRDTASSFSPVEAHTDPNSQWRYDRSRAPSGSTDDYFKSPASGVTPSIHFPSMMGNPQASATRASSHSSIYSGMPEGQDSHARNYSEHMGSQYRSSQDQRMFMPHQPPPLQTQNHHTTHVPIDPSPVSHQQQHHRQQQHQQQQQQQQQQQHHQHQQHQQHQQRMYYAPYSR